MLQVIDTYGEIQKLLETGSVDRDAYWKYAAGISETLPKMVEEDIRGYDFENQVLPVLQYFYAHRDLAKTAHNSFLQAVEGLEEKCRRVGYGTLDSTVVLYMGLCCAAGWATELDGRPAVLLGIEKIVELNWVDEASMIGLVYHELGHNWHNQNRRMQSRVESPRQKALWQLYTEGVAMYYEQLLCGDGRFFHQDRDGWLDWCEENERRLAKEYLRRVESGESVQDFFGDWCNFEGRSDVGYYLGARVIHRICEERGIAEMVDLPLEEVEDFLKRLSC